MSNTLLFVRHAPLQSNPDTPAQTWLLTEKGQIHCHQIASQLTPYTPTHIITSDKPNTRQTAKILADALQIPWQTAPDLQESKRETVPWFETVDEFLTAATQLFLHPHQRVFGEESAHEALARFEGGVQNVLQQYAEDTTIIVTHGTVLSLFIAKYNDIDVVDYWESLSLPALIVVNLPNFQLQQTFNWG